jgi:cytidylate kinase
MAVITLSRHFGAGGKTLGKLLAKKLGYFYIDDDIIQSIVNKSMSTEWMTVLEKELGGNLLQWISNLPPKDPVKSIFEKKEDAGEACSIDILQRVMVQIAEQGNAVIVGRGGQYLLQDQKDVFHVLMVADLEDRVQFMEERYHLSLKKALHVVNHQDKRRQNFYRFLGKLDYDQPDMYHLVLNMSKLTLQKACEILTVLVKGM